MVMLIQPIYIHAEQCLSQELYFASLRKKQDWERGMNVCMILRHAYNEAHVNLVLNKQITPLRIQHISARVAKLHRYNRASASCYFALVNLTKECNISLVKYQMA